MLLFMSDRVYKLLKPIRTGFLDHTDRESRIRAITDEYELNRRLAPDVYLGLADLAENEHPDDVSDARRVVADRLLIMRRLPDERSLSALADKPEFADHLRRVAHTIAAFHASLPPIVEPVPLATAGGLRTFWESSLVEIAPSIGDVIEAKEFAEVERLATAYLDHHADLFERRRTDGFVRDGHGDLIAADIFMLDDGPRILDCLAFDGAYRTCDVLADIAFLVMDVEHLVGRLPSSQLMRWYCEYANEHHPGSLAHHYVAYRAHVRAKVAVIRHRQGDPDAAVSAQRFHRQTVEHLRRAQPSLILVGGGPGAGKTTVAAGLADALNCSVLDSDTLRKDLFGVDHDDHDVAAHPDLYADATTQRTYERLVAQAGRLLADGESVILDATWAHAAFRELACAEAERHGAALVEIECVLDARLAKRRITDRQRRGLDPSDAHPALVDQAQREPWPTASRIDTDDAPDAILDAVFTSILR
jgi:uncharacterized protein